MVVLGVRLVQTALGALGWAVGCLRLRLLVLKVDIQGMRRFIREYIGALGFVVEGGGMVLFARFPIFSVVP